MAGGVTVTLGGEDVSAVHSRVRDISITRGRQDELDRTGTGTATVSLNYVEGSSISDFVGAAGTITLANPVGSSGVVFDGIVDEVLYDLDDSQVVTRVDVVLVDALDFLASIEIAPGVNGILPLPATVDDGNIFYEQEIPQDRINTAIAESGFAGATEIFTGNVQVKDTVYAPRANLLTVIHDAADAEFPGVANVFVQRDGTFTFHGRLARFNPGDAQYHITTYAAGDGAACLGNSGRAHIRRLRLGSSRKNIINAALATPEKIADADIEGQIVTDSGSISTYGLRSWSAENLLTFYDDLNNLAANPATLQFAQYYVDNYAAPQIRVEDLTFKSIRPGHENAGATWDVLCHADISDIIALQVTNPGIAVNSEYFIEGVRYSIRPLNGSYALVEMSLDLSPRAYWDYAF